MVLSATPIIPQNTSDVKLKTQNMAESATFSAVPAAPTAATTVPVKFCASFATRATNEWTVLSMPLVWIGEELITLNGDIFEQLSEDEKAKELVFTKLDDRRVRAIISAPLLQTIQARSTYNLSTHNGEIRFVNGREFTFRAHTQKDGKRVIQERKSKTLRALGTITPDGTVALTPNLKRHADAGAPYALKIATKAKMLNDPERAIGCGVQINFTGKCRRCNRKLSDPKSVAEGVGSVCRGKEVSAAIAQPVVHDSNIELPHTGAVISTLEALPITAIVPAQRTDAHIPQIHIHTGSAPLALLPAPVMALPPAADVSDEFNRDMAAEECIMRGLCVIEDMLNELASEGLLMMGAAPMYATINERFGIHETSEVDSKSYIYQRRNVQVFKVENSMEWGAEKETVTNLVESASRPSLSFNEAWDPKTGKQPVMPIHLTPEPLLPQELDKIAKEWVPDLFRVHSLTPAQINWCCEQLGTMGLSEDEIDPFFFNALECETPWCPDFMTQRTTRRDDPAFLYQLCDRYADWIVPIDELVPLSGEPTGTRRDSEEYTYVIERDGKMMVPSMFGGHYALHTPSRRRLRLPIVHYLLR